MARTDTLGNFLTDVAEAIRNKKGSTDKILASNFDTEIESIETGTSIEDSEYKFTGHYDIDGLKTIGWTDEEINYYQQNGVRWNESEDSYFILTEDELSGDESSSTRFLPKSSTITKFNNYYSMIAIPLLNTVSITNISGMFNYCYSLITIPLLNTASVTNMSNMFNYCHSLTAIPLLDTSKVINMSYMFNCCYSLKTIPLLNTASVTNMSNMFKNCYSLTTIPLLNTASVTNMNNMFNYCHSLKTIPLLDTSNVTSIAGMFQNCYSLTTIPLLDTSKITNMSNMFNCCYSLKIIPLLDTSKVTNIYNMFYYCRSLKTIPLLDASSVNYINNTFRSCDSLENIDGLYNLGKAYSTSNSANYSYYILDLTYCPNLTHDSLMNVINNLYDIATKGCNSQSLQLGSANIAKLTEDEIAIATNKGWTVS